MASFNRVILMGNLTRDPELRYTPSGTAVCEIGLAVNDRRRNPDGEWVEETTFVDVVLWSKTAETCNQYLSKGAPVLIEGRLKLDTWEQEGQKRSKLRVVGEKMQMLGGRSQGGQGGQGGYQGNQGGYQQGGYPQGGQGGYSQGNPNAGRPAQDGGYGDYGQGRYNAPGPQAPPESDIPF